MIEDKVNHPNHYTFGQYEVLDVIEDWDLPYHLGNAIKYIARAGRKDPSKEIEDLRKAKFYLERYIDIKGRENESEASKVPYKVFETEQKKNNKRNNDDNL